MLIVVKRDEHIQVFCDSQKKKLGKKFNGISPSQRQVKEPNSKFSACRSLHLDNEISFFFFS